MKNTTLMTRYVVLILISLLAGCVTVIVEPPVTYQTVTVRQPVNVSLPEEPPAPPPMIQAPPQIIERTVRETCTIPKPPESGSWPVIPDRGEVILRQPGDTEDLLVDHILELRAFIYKRERSLDDFYREITTLCQ